MTIVELIIALLIVMIAFAALASTLISSFAAIRSNENRVVATALANETIEDMTTMPWGQLGLYTGDPTLPFDLSDPADDPVFEDEQVVLLEDDEGVPAHLEDDVARDGRQYTLTRWVTFVEEDEGSDLKRMVVIVSWDGGARTIRMEGLRAPDPADLLDLQIISLHVESDGTGDHRVQLRPPHASDNELTNQERFDVIVEVGDADSSLTLSFRDRSGALRVLTAPDGEGTTVRAFTISQHAYEFPHGPVPFLATATGPQGQVASDTTNVRFFQDVNIVDAGDVVVEGENTPAVVSQEGQVDNLIEIGPGCTPTDDVTIMAEIWGMTANEAGEPDALFATWAGPDGDTQPAPLPLGQMSPTKEGGVYGALVQNVLDPDQPEDVEFIVGSYIFRIDAIRTVDNDSEHPFSDDDLQEVSVTVVAADDDVEAECGPS